MKSIQLYFFLPLMALSLLTSCDGGSGKSHSSSVEGDTIAVRYAANLSMVDYGDFLRVSFRNPWDTTRILQSFILLDRNKPVPDGLEDEKIILTPVKKSVVYTSAHNRLIDELGALDAVTGVCDARYIFDSNVRGRISDGRIADCGSSMSPNIEKIMMLNPEVILLSAYEDSNDHNKVGQTGITVIDCIDYMEISPLGRAEWMRFFGRLYGEGERADSLFEVAERSYKELSRITASVDRRPKVLTEMIYGSTWDVPGALSTVGVMIEDAGGRNPFDLYRRSGSVRLAPEEVLMRAGDSDIWLLKYSSDTLMTLKSLSCESPFYSRMRPLSEGNVYGCNVDRSPLFEDGAFHPHWILGEYVALLHPELAGDSAVLRYYHKLR